MPIVLFLCGFRVDYLEVANHDIFEDRPFPYNIVSFLHITTTEATIRNLLTFKTGDTVSPEILEENERRLRALGLFGDVDVVRLREGDTSIVWVGTRDLWSTSVYTDLSGGGGLTRFGLGFTEHNFLGMAKTLSGKYQKDYERSYWEAEYQDPDFAGLGPEGYARYQSRSDGFLLEGSLTMPFRTVKERWSWWAGGGIDSGRVYAYERGEISDSEIYSLRRVCARLSRNLSESAILAPFAEVMSWDRRGLDTLRWAGPGLGLVWEERRYYKTSFLRGFGYVEDFFMGPRWEMGAWLYRGGWGCRVSARVGGHLGRVLFWEASPFLSYRQVERRDITKAELVSRLYIKPHERSTIALSLFAGSMEGQPGLTGYKLGGTSGLRGWPGFYFWGQKKFLAQSEIRLAGPEIASIAVPGAVFFWDGGGVDGEFAWDTGAGLRLGMTRVFRFPEMRLDVAWPRAQGSPVWSFGTNQAF